MKFKLVFRTLGKMMFLEGALLLVPLFISLFYKEGTYAAFLIPSLILMCIGLIILLFCKPDSNNMFAREGFVTVALSWIVLSLFGTLPFLISKEIPRFVDALFETVSGFTTTGATCLPDVEALSKGINFWRIMTHFVGGMGIVVFILAILPSAEKNGAKNIFILRAESTGPSASKVGAKVKFGARILYLIYLGLTLILAMLLFIGKNSLYDSFMYALSTAGTGGFGLLNSSLADVSSYTQIVIGIFMILYGINFNMFYLLLIGKVKDIFKNSELRWYIGIVICSIVIIFFNILKMYDTAALAFKDSFFQVAAIVSTTGFTTADFNTWPMLAKFILVLLMFFGSCAGSTAGGLKISRIVITIKSITRDIKSFIHPSSVLSIHMDGKVVDEAVIDNTKNYLYTYVILFIVFMGLISINGFDFETTFTSVAACFNNIGPGLGLIGPTGNFSIFSDFSKIVLSLSMLVGRLEIYPILILFSFRTYKK